MNLTRTLLRFPLGFLAGLALLIGCQSTSGPEPVTSTAMTVKGSVEFADTLRLPDFGVWRTNNAARAADTGRGSVVCTIKPNGKSYDCSQSFALKNVLGNDWLLQDMYALGVHFGTLSYSQTGNQPQLTYLGKDYLKLFAFESNLIRLFNADFKAKNKTNEKPTPADLVTYYVGLLLTADPSVKDSAFPKGLVADSVKKILVQVAAQENVTAKALAAKALLGLTNESMIRTITDALVKAGVKIDTMKLFPPVPVRVVDSLKIASDLIEGEGEVAVSGSFTWESRALIRRQYAKVVNAQGVEDENIRVLLDQVPDVTSGSWVLTGHLSLQAKRGAKVGIDTLIVTVEGDSGKATSRTAFRVLRGDTTLPELSITQPAGDTEVTSTTEKITVVVKASDAKGIAEVKIGNAVRATAPYSAEVDLSVGYNFIYVQAKDNAGNVSFDTVVVQRKRSTTNTDAVEPVITLRSPLKDTSTVATGLANFEISWTATDNVGIKRVILNDSEVTGSAGAYAKTVALQDGNNTYEIKAFDDAGNAAKKSVTIQRPADQSKPGITAPADQTVGSDVATIKLTWKITNSHKVSKLTLNGTEIAVAAEISSDVALKPGANSFNLVVTDASGANVSETVVITRTVEVVIVLPSITALADRSVGVDQDTAILTWAITNSEQAKSATLNGEVVSVGATISKTVKLDPGANVFKLLLKDASGAEVSSSTTVTRAIDTTVLGIAKLSDASVGVEDSVTTLSWSIMHSNKAVSADINGSSAVVGPTISRSVNLVPGPNVFKLTLTDSKGGTVSSSVTILRAIDTALLAVSKPSDRSVSPETETDTIAWMVFNSAKAVSATLNGNPVTVGVTIKSVVSLVPGNNPFTLVLTDAKGKTVSDTVIVSRAADVTGPSLAWVTPPTKTVSVDATETSYAVQVKVTDASGVDSVLLNGVVTKKESGDLYSMTLALPKPDGNPILVAVAAKDAKGNWTRDTVSVARKAPDGTNKPIITLKKPTAATGNTLPFETAVLHIEAEITDALLAVNPDSVKFNGVVAKATGSVYAADVPVPATGKAFTIMIKAVNTNGIASTLDVVVTRAVDNVNPVIAPDATTKTQSVDFDTKTIALSWTVSDNVAVTGLKYNGLAETVIAATVKKTLPLDVGANTATLIATDEAGNADTSVVVITRKQDATPPVVTITSPKATDPALAWDKTSVTVTATATNAGGSGIAYVMIGQTKVLVAPYTAIVSGLKAGANTITVKAVGNNDSSATATVVVNVTVDDAGPVLAITAPVNNYVIPYPGTTVDVVTATATDAVSGLATIKIGTTTCTKSPCEAKNVAPDALGNITVVATDNAGKTTTKSITVTIATDNTKPVITWSGAASKEVVVGASSSSYKATWTVTDNELVSVTIDKVAATAGTSNTFSKVVSVSTDKQLINIVAKDKSNTSTDQLTARLVTAPTITPAGGTFTAATQVSIAAPLGTIEYQIGTDAWKAYTGPFPVSVTSTIKTRATYGGVTETSAAAVGFYINYDANLKSLKVGNNSVFVPVGGGATLAMDSLPGLTKQVVLTYVTNDPAATVKINGGTSNTVTLINDSVTVNIVITNGNATQIYRLNLYASHSGYFNDGRDDQTYRAAKIGDQWWMAHNLSFKAPTGSTDSVGACYNGPQCAYYGRHYSQAEAITAGICPVGWHVPSVDEWNTLATVAGGLALAGKTLKSSMWDGTDAFGFEASAAGEFSQKGETYSGTGDLGEYWTSSESGRIAAIFESGRDDIRIDNVGYLSLSVRCVAD